jgi:hypothetical protein
MKSKFVEHTPVTMYMQWLSQQFSCWETMEIHTNNEFESVMHRYMEYTPCWIFEHFIETELRYA